MIAPHATPTRLAAGVSSTDSHIMSLHGVAAGTLMVLLIALLVMWPIPYLGFNVDLATGMITEVEPGSAADRAHLAVSDRIVGMYDYAWSDIERRLFLYPISWQAITSVPAHLERDGQIVSVDIPVDPPTLDFQVEKVAGFLLGLLFWFVGYMLGIMRRQNSAGVRIVAWFWMILGGLIGTYTFASYTSYVLKLGLQWALLTIMMPLSVYVNVRFPARPTAIETIQRARFWLIVAILGLQAVFLSCVLIIRPTLLEMIDLLGPIIASGFLIAFLWSWRILADASRSTASAHLRRQIRILEYACLLTAGCWICLRTIPGLIGIDSPIPDYAIDLLSGLIPLAYLTIGLIPDLRHLDRLLHLACIHAFTILVLGGLAFGGAYLLEIQRPVSAVWISIMLVVVYRPAYRMVSRFFPTHPSGMHPYTPLVQAATELTETLDAHQQAIALCRGIQMTFGATSIACYLSVPARTGDLLLAYEIDLLVAGTLTTGALLEYLRSQPNLITSHELYNQLQTVTLQADESAIVHDSRIVLWCPIIHTTGALLGLVLVGMRGDLDPYHAEDIHELRRLIDSAALALTNSMAYIDLAQSEQTIRQLYQRYQQAQAMTSAAIARELHDEVINVTLRLNTEAAERLINTVSDPEIHHELTMILEGDQSAIRTLRVMCANLYPVGIEDPFALPFVLRRQVERLHGQWPGHCSVVVEHETCPVDQAVQWECLRITREAVTNAMKHAHDATEIVVTLRFPSADDPQLCLCIRDNGWTETTDYVRLDGFGMRNMRESARTIGGELTIQPALDGGTEVMFVWNPNTPLREPW